MKRRPGRPSKDVVRTTVNIEADVMAELELYLLDPRRGSLKYGSLTTVINKLLRQFIRELSRPEVDTIKFLSAYGVDLDIPLPSNQEE